MTFLRAFAIAIATFVSLAASAAITLTPLTGSTPQTAHPLSNFGMPIGVVATDAGVPVQGLPVTFQLPDPPFFIVGPGGVYTVSTDAQGIATLPAPGVTASNVLGTFTWSADEPSGASTTFTLTIAGAYPAQVSVVSGANQVVAPGQVFPLPFVAQVIGSDGAPIPFPLVFFGGPDLTVPSGTFPGGLFTVVVIGDANGIATSPPYTADAILGSESAIALGESGPGPTISAFFPFTIAQPLTLTLAPVPGSTPQTTRLNSFFPVPVGVIARNADGTPAVGVTLTFSAPFDTIALIPDRSNVFDATTGADGIAWASSPVSPKGYIAFNPGSSVITVSSPLASSAVQIMLSTSGKPGTRLERIAGDDQFAQLGGAYAPWIVRAWDEDNQAVPYAAVLYDVTQPGPGPAATFENGSTEIYLPADAQGIGMSPTLTANGIEGGAAGNATLEGYALDQFSPLQFFSFVNLRNPGFKPLRAWETPPRSIPIGATTAIPFSVKVTNAAGLGLANVPVVFSTDSHCATFGGAASFTASTGVDGVATSGALTGVRASTSCATSAHAMGQALDLTMHVYDPARVVATASPPFVFTHLDTSYNVRVQFTEHGLPVQVSNFDIHALPHAGASYATTPVADIYDGSALLYFTPTQKPGAYSIEFRSGSTQLVIPVVQVP